ncbi:SLATT domain-containing protein [Neisseria perflava]|uniref:SLATT domain-containing protein n=1 Tax=Neisseria perflava TaxID=33053 RepID=UPI00209F0168|nr:SLATT domain-containing protein [Neisseria perflava]MCP1660291.1 hypothetical protein [Neisseria perflava]MCP1771546.1 hypothetical protein [Neisseria perflava]
MGNSEQKKEKSAFEQLLYSARITANCKYIAADRLMRFKHLTFCVTTMLSLGLIFIPLWVMHYPPPHKFSAEFLNIFQIFLAVATLVYSVIISMAGYDLRIYKLQDCGGKLRAFVKKLRVKQDNSRQDIFNKSIEKINKDEATEETNENTGRIVTDEDMGKYQKEYHQILSSAEQHMGIDYLIHINSDKEYKDKVFSSYYFKKFWSLHTAAFFYLY